MKVIKINNVMSGWGQRTGDGKQEGGWELFVRYSIHIPKTREGGKHPDYF